MGAAVRLSAWHRSALCATTYISRLCIAETSKSYNRVHASLMPRPRRL